MANSLFKYMELWVLIFCGYKPFKNLIKAMDFLLEKQN